MPDSSSYVSSTLRSMGDDIAKLSEMQDLQNDCIDEVVSMAMNVDNRMRLHWTFIERYDLEIWRLQRDLRRWQVLVLVMAGWMMVGTLLWCFGVI